MASTSSACTRTGEVLTYSSKLGWGHIKPDDLSANIFVHQQSLHCYDGFRTLVEGQRVQYEIEAREGEKPQAVHVTGPGGAYLDEPVFASARPVAEPTDASRARAKAFVPRVLAARAPQPGRQVAAPGSGRPAGAPARAVPLPSTGVTAAVAAVAAPSAKPAAVEAVVTGGGNGVPGEACTEQPKKGAAKRKRSKRQRSSGVVASAEVAHDAEGKQSEKVGAEVAASLKAIRDAAVEEAEAVAPEPEVVEDERPGKKKRKKKQKQGTGED